MFFACGYASHSLSVLLLERYDANDAQLSRVCHVSPVLFVSFPLTVPTQRSSAQMQPCFPWTVCRTPPSARPPLSDLPQGAAHGDRRWRGRRARSVDEAEETIIMRLMKNRPRSRQCSTNLTFQRRLANWTSRFFRSYSPRSSRGAPIRDRRQGGLM